MAWMPRHAVGGYFVEESIVGGIRERPPGLDDETGAKAIEDGSRTANVVGVRVGHNQRRECRRSLSRQKGHDHTLARVPTIRPGTRIDHHEATVGRAKNDPVALPHVEKM
jgi:hypothetical protein